MITVYGADWCEDTRRARRHLRRLRVPHRYVNVDEDLDAVAYVMAATDGTRRTPVIQLSEEVAPLVEPDDDTLTGALVELEMLTRVREFGSSGERRFELPISRALELPSSRTLAALGLLAIGVALMWKASTSRVRA